MLSCQLDFFLDYVEILRKFEVEKVDEKFEKVWSVRHRAISESLHGPSIFISLFVIGFSTSRQIFVRIK